MTFVQLEYIVAVANYRHFATAASHCFVTQPTLSMQIQKLEEELGVKIFDRSKHPVVPTEAGTAIIEQARKLLSLRRRVVPAFAVAAAAATLTWIVVPQMQTAGAPGAVQVASAGAPQNGNLQRVTVAQASAQPGLQDVNIIRDASLDQYLEAHQQFAQQPVVTGSMPLIRAAVTTTPGQ